MLIDWAAVPIFNWIEKQLFASELNLYSAWVHWGWFCAKAVTVTGVFANAVSPLTP